MEFTVSEDKSKVQDVASVETKTETATPVEETETEQQETQESTSKESTTEEEKTPEQKAEEEAAKEDGGNKTIRHMRKMIKQLSKEVQELRSTKTPELAPERSAYESDEAYIKAQVDHQVKQALNQQQAPKDVFIQKFEEAKKSHEDFEEALEDISHVKFTPSAEVVLREAIETLQYGSDLLYHIAKNPEVAEEISILPPGAFAARLGELHAEIRQQKGKASKAKQSSAPAPIKPVKPTGSSDRDYDKMSFQEFCAARRQEKKKHSMVF